MAFQLPPGYAASNNIPAGPPPPGRPPPGYRESKVAPESKVGGKGGGGLRAGSGPGAAGGLRLMELSMRFVMSLLDAAGAGDLELVGDGDGGGDGGGGGAGKGVLTQIDTMLSHIEPLSLVEPAHNHSAVLRRRFFGHVGDWLCNLATRGDCGGEGDGAMRSEAIGAALSLALGLGNLGGFLRLVEMLLQDSVQGVGLHKGRCKKMVDFIFAASLSQYEQTRDR